MNEQDIALHDMNEHVERAVADQSEIVVDEELPTGGMAFPGVETTRGIDDATMSPNGNVA